MIAAVKSWLAKFTTAGKLAAELQRMGDALTVLRAERESIITAGDPEASGARLAELREIESALCRRIDLARIPALALRVAEAVKDRDEKLAAYTLAHKLQHSESDRLKAAFETMFDSKTDAKKAVMLQPVTLRSARAARWDARAALNDAEQTLRNLKEALADAERKAARAARLSLNQPDPAVNAISAARSAAGMLPASAAEEVSPLPKANC